MGPTFFIPFVKNIVLFITVIVLYMVMSGPLKFPRWLAFILAPLITFLLFFFVGGSADNLLGTDILSGITTGTDQEKIIQIDQQIAEKQREVGQILAIFKAEDVLPSTLTTDTKAEDITSTQLEAINSMILQKYKPGPIPPSV
jgi:hypothetical protein